MEEVNLIQAVCDRINSDKCKLESKELGIIEVDSFNLSDFWSQFGAAVQSLSNQVTKLSFMCGKSPFPTQEELNGMLGDLMQHYSLMRDLYQVLPEEVGATVHNAVTSAVLDIMSSLLAVTNSLNDISDKGAKERLPMTSTFWDACNAVESLPRNNLTATLKALEAETALATDAQEELTAVSCTEKKVAAGPSVPTTNGSKVEQLRSCTSADETTKKQDQPQLKRPLNHVSSLSSLPENKPKHKPKRRAKRKKETARVPGSGTVRNSAWCHQQLQIPNLGRPNPSGYATNYPLEDPRISQHEEYREAWERWYDATQRSWPPRDPYSGNY